MIDQPTQTWRYGDIEIPLTEAAVDPGSTFNKVLSSMGTLRIFVTQ